MSKPTTAFRYITLATTLLSAVFIFFDWFKLSVPLLDAFLESGTLHISYMTLPSLVEENALGLITRMGGRATAVTTLLLCAVLKYFCILSAGLGICGIWKVCIKNRASRTLFVSQIIAIALQVVALMMIIIINVFISVYAPAIGDMFNISEELVEFRFIPTVWALISVVSAILSLIFSQKYIGRQD